MQNNNNEKKEYYEEYEGDSEIGYPVHVYFIELANMYSNRIRWHWHPELEILIINHGQAEFLSDDLKIVLSAGQGILVNHNVMHSVVPVKGDINCSIYSLVFHPAFLFGYGHTNTSDRLLIPVISSTSMRAVLLDESDPTQEKMLDRVNRIIAANVIKTFGYELVTKTLLCELWLILLENMVEPAARKARNTALNSDEMRAKDIILYIEEHYSEKITLEDLADFVHISKSECCRCFKRALKLTPVEYVMKYRIFTAANMIKSNDPASQSYSDLAFSVGFNNASYFNKIFKQYMGCTPSEYKRRTRQDASYVSDDPFIL